MSTDFTTHTPKSGNPLEGRSETFIWRCSHGQLKGPSSPDEMPWDSPDCYVVAYRVATEDDSALEAIKIYETCNIIGHLYNLDTVSAEEVVFRIIRGEDHAAVAEEVLGRLIDRALDDVTLARAILFGSVGAR